MKYSIGIDIGGTNIRVAVVDESGNIIKVIKEPTDKSDGKNSLLKQILQLYHQIDAESFHPIGIGVGVPGPCNPKDGSVYIIPNLDITDIPLKETLEKNLKLPVFVGNDANVAALAEAIVGNGKEKNIVQYLTLSTGIGGGLVINKKMVTGHYGFGQEVGNMVIQRGGRRPSIYKPGGCIEGLSSGSMLVVEANEKGLNIQHAGELFELAERKNKIALQIKSEWLENMAAFIGSIVAYMEPDIFVLGGGLMKSAHYFLLELTKKVDEYVFEYLRGKIKIVPAKYDQDAGIIGAAMQAFIA